MDDTTRVTKKLTSFNYWKNANITKYSIFMELADSMLLIHNSMTFEDQIEIINNLPRKEKVVVYVSFTKTFDSIQELLKLSKQKLYIVDFISSNLFKRESTPDCFFSQTPGTLEGFLKLIEQIFDQVNPSYVIIDSLSYFINFFSFDGQRNLSPVKNFFAALYNEKRIQTILLYDEQTMGRIEHLPVSSFETIVKVDVFKEEIDWSE